MNKKLVNLIILHAFRKVKFFILPAKASEKAPNHFSDSVPTAVTLSLYNSPTDGKYLLHIQKFPLSGILSHSPYWSKLPLDIHPVGDSHLYFRKTLIVFQFVYQMVHMVIQMFFCFFSNDQFISHTVLS